MLQCYSENATLAMPKNENEANVLKKIFEQFPKSTLAGVTHPDYFLLGFHDAFSEGEFLTDEGISYIYCMYMNHAQA